MSLYISIFSTYFFTFTNNGKIAEVFCVYGFCILWNCLWYWCWKRPSILSKNIKSKNQTKEREFDSKCGDCVLTGDAERGYFVFGLKKEKKKLLFYVADGVIVIGCALLSWGKKEGLMYLARFMVGLGCSLLTILAPILASEVWPDTLDVLATAGICYQFGQILSEAFDTVYACHLSISHSLVIQTHILEIFNHTVYLFMIQMSFSISLLGLSLVCLIQSVLVACSSNVRS